MTELWEVAKKERLVHVKGSPASGKTTLRRLLEYHIFTTDPEYKIYSFGAWDREVIDAVGGCDGELQRVTGMDSAAMLNSEIKIVLLFDEGQTSYWDKFLWNEFLKSLELGVGPCVIMFCSYGSADSMPADYRDKHNTRPPLSLKRTQRVGLWATPTMPLCLNFSYAETENMIKRSLSHYPDKPVFDEDLIKYLHSITNGYVGALVTLLDIIIRVIFSAIYLMLAN